MTNLSTDELATQIIEADKAGDKSTLSALSQEWKRRKQTPQIGAPDYSSLGDATRVPGPQGFMEDSGINAIGRGIRENIGGGAGAAIGSAAGMEAGGTVGTFIGGPGVGTAVGAGVGGVGGGILGALFGGQAQQAVFPTSEDTKRILQSDETNHPMMSFAGQIIPYLATLKPSIGGIKSAITPLNATMSAAERQAVIGHRVGTVLGAGLGGASEVAMPLIQGREVDPTRVLASTVLGALFNEPNRLGKAIGLPSTPTLAEVRAKQMAASMPEVPTSTAMVPFEQAPLIPTEVVNPRAVGMPETGAYPVGNTDVRFVQPRMLEGDAPPLQLPASAEAGADTVMPAMRQEQAAAMQEQLTRLTERRAGMASRGAGKPALAAVDKQIKARQNALKGLQNESTIIAPPAAETGLPIVEQGVAVPPPDRTPVAVETPPPMDPRMRALATGEDRIATGERPAFMSADAITQERLARDAAAQSSSNAVALREQLATQETTPRTTARAEDFSNPNEFYRVIVGDDAFNDIISTGTVRTNASSKVEPGASITQRLKGRPTAFPSFSKGQVSLSYAGENPGHYVVVTSDPSMMPSSSGRHSKGKTMFPTNDAGEHMTHLSGKSVRVFKHMGDGQYDLVYDRGSVIGGRNKFPSAQSPSNAVVVKALDGADLDNLGAAAGVKRQGVGDEAYREKIIGNTHPDDLQDAINATSNPTHNEKSPSISGKPSPADSVTPVSDVPSVVDTPEVASLRKQIEQIDEDIALAHDDGDAPGVKALESARAKIQSQLDEAASPTMPKTLGDKIRAKKAKLKGDTFNLPIAGISGDDARRLWNGALEVAAKLADAGTNIREAAKQAAAWARQQFPRARFKDDEFHSAIEADVVEGLGAARKAGVKEESFKAAEQMDNNPDKFFADAGETPVSSYMDSVSQTMKDAKHDMLSGRTAKRVWQHLKDFNRNFLRGNQAALDELAKGGSGTGRKSPALDKLNERINGTRPGASGVSKRGLYDEVITNARARSNELNEAYNGIRSTVDTLKGHEKEAFLANLVKWMQMDNSPTHLRNQPAVLKAVDTIRKVSRDIIEDLKKVGIDIGDSGIKYFNRSLDADVVKRNYDEFVTGMAKIYDQQWKQTDPKYVSDMVKATEAAKAYADATILGHDDIHLDGSDLLLSGKQRTSDPDFFKARTFTGAAGDELDRTMAKFYKRNPFETINTQINRAERRIGLAKAFGKTTWDADAGKYVLDPTARWKEFTDAAIKEGNEKIVPEVRERYQTMFGIGGNFNPSTMAFNQFTREMGYYAYLPFSGINSMVEPTVMAMRLNKPVSGLFQAYGKTFRSIARQLKDMPLDYKEKLADALGLAENATMRAARSLGRMDEQGMMTSKNLASYMFLTGNSVVSNATSNAAVDIGMSALRVALLDHQHGQGGNTPRIWLEELGIKKADFDAVSKWLEGHVTDEDRFGAVLDGSREANIVRDALSKFVREGRSLPDAGTKSKTFSSPAGSMLLSLQSFLYDFADKVLGRNARQFMQGVKGEVHFDGDIDPTKLSAQDRMHLMAPMAMGMPALLAANYGIALIRETMYPDPEKIRRDRERTNGEINWNRFQRALSRTNALGPYDMLFNMFTQARYERDVAAMAVGPYMGGVLELAKNVAALSGERNSGNTNTAERKAVRSAWNIGPKPLLNMALSSLPATRALTPIAAAGIQIGSQRSAAEGAVDLVAGKAQDTRNKKKSK